MNRYLIWLAIFVCMYFVIYYLIKENKKQN